MIQKNLEESRMRTVQPHRILFELMLGISSEDQTAIMVLSVQLDLGSLTYRWDG